MIFKLLPKGTPFIKRLFDLLLAALALIVLSPVLLLVSLLVALGQGFPILFRQPRPGYRGEIFTVFKFRTMRQAANPDGAPLPDDQTRQVPQSHQPG